MLSLGVGILTRSLFNDHNILHILTVMPKKRCQDAFSDLPRGAVLPGNIIREDVQINQLCVPYGML